MRLQMFLYLAFAILPYQADFIYDMVDLCSKKDKSKNFFFNRLKEDNILTKHIREEEKKVLKVKIEEELRVVKSLLLDKINMSAKDSEIRTLKNLSEYWFVNSLDDKDKSKDRDFCFYDEKRIYILMKAFDFSLDNVDNHHGSNKIYETPSWRLFAIQAVGNAMVRLHNLRYLHRDIKPQNVFAKDVFDIVLGDFDLTIHLPTEKGEAIVNGYKNGDIAGTSVYIAPEALGRGIYSVKSDAFSFGVLIFNLLTNETFRPVHKVYDNLFELINNYEGCKKTFLRGSPTDLYCNYFKNLVKKLISKNPCNRPYGYALIKELYEAVFKAYMHIKETSRELDKILEQLKADENNNITQLKNHLDMINPHDFESELNEYIERINNPQQQKILRIDNSVFIVKLQEPYKTIDPLDFKSELNKYIEGIKSSQQWEIRRINKEVFTTKLQASLTIDLLESKFDDVDYITDLNNQIQISGAGSNCCNTFI